MCQGLVSWLWFWLCLLLFRHCNGILTLVCSRASRAVRAVKMVRLRGSIRSFARRQAYSLQVSAVYLFPDLQTLHILVTLRSLPALHFTKYNYDPSNTPNYPFLCAKCN